MQRLQIGCFTLMMGIDSFSMSLPLLDLNFYYWKIFCLGDVQQFIYPFIYWKTSWLLPRSSNSGLGSKSIHVQVLAWAKILNSLNSKEDNCWILLTKLGKLSSCFPKWLYYLYYFVFSMVLNVSSWWPTYSQASGGVCSGFWP